MVNLVERFIKYAKFNTKSQEDNTSTPSTSGQIDFAKELVEELKVLGLMDITLDEKGYIMATLPSNVSEDVPTVGFIAHLDTSPDMNGENVNPRIVERYNGEDIILNLEKKLILSPKDFPDLKKYIDQPIITTDGTTLLGGDDKAGIAEIITAMEYFINNPMESHGTIRIAFTPDEEIGHGADFFDVKKFNSDFAYTVDGGEVGELEYENFNAASLKVIINGRNVHPGTAKGIMVNSMLIAGEFINVFPKDETPATTEDYEGFYHLTNLKGDVEETTLNYIIRDFDEINFEKKKAFAKEICKTFNEKYGSDTVTMEIKDQYRNMKEMIIPEKHIVDIAINAMKDANVVPKVRPIRGGTDGARLSFMGLPTPNIFTGGHNFHGRFEYIPIKSMEKAVEVIINIIKINAASNR